MPKHDSTQRRSNRSSSSESWMSSAKKHPMATAAAAAGAAGAVAAGAFLWTKRREVSDQMSRMGRKASEWVDEMASKSSSRELATTEGPNESAAIEASRATTGQARTAKVNMKPARAGAQTVSR